MRYSLAAMKAVLCGDMARFFALAAPNDPSAARAKAGSTRPAAKATAPAEKPKRFMDYVAETMGAGKTKREAVAAVAKQHPDLHAAYLREFNAQAQERQQRDRQKAADARAAFGR